MNMQPFSMPDTGLANSISVTTTTASVLVEGTGNQMMFTNATSQGCYIAAGDSTIEADSGRLFLPGNTMRVFTVPPSYTHAAAITASGTTTVIVARGDGF